MASNKVGSFYYFAYGTYVDRDVLTQALTAASESATPTILRSHPAILPGYRLSCDAVSAEGPRLGRLNIFPSTLVSREPAGKRVHRPAVHNSSSSSEDAAAACASAFRDGVRGILYELSANARAPLLQAVAREGSFNVYAMLACYELSDVRHGVRSPDAALHEALVIAALDLPLMERKYLLEPTIKLRWMPLPAPEGVPVPPGLSSKALATTVGATQDSKLEEKEKSDAKDGSSENKSDHSNTDSAASFRWPGLHWCNCISSTRVAPSCAYVAAIQKAYTQYLLLQTATEEDAENVEKTTTAKKREHRDNNNDHDGKSAEVEEEVSYGQAIYRMVYLRARDLAKDPLEEKTWYLAYGSNLSWEQVCLRIGPPYQRRAVRLPEYVLVANKTPLNRVEYASFGYFNVEPVSVREAKAASGLTQHRSTMPPYVCGAAYEISMAQLEMMDGYETGYDRELLRCTDLCDPAAAPWDCWTYIAQETSEELLPSREYLARVLEGSDILPLEYMEGIRATPSNPLRSPRQDQRLRKEI